MGIVNPRTMRGVLELLPREQIAFQRLLDTIRSGYERFGFLPIETPVMELKEVLLTKSGGETEKQVYLAQSSGARAQGEEPKLVMRFDLTVPLARYVAEHENALVFPFRRYQMQRVYRGESAQRGRFREFYQCDVDIIGKDSLGLVNDAEIPVVIAHVFEKLEVGAFTIRISNRKILGGLMESLGIPPEQRTLVMREIDKLDKRGADAVRKTLLGDAFALGEAGVDRLLGVVGLTGSNAEVIERLRGLGVDNETFSAGVSELATVLDAIADFGLSEERYRADLSIARGLDYYTGTVYETFLDDHLEVGSVCSGGRYENLAGFYTDSKLPGVGISIGASRLFDQLRAAGLIQAADASSVQVLVTQMDAELAPLYRRVASDLREAGVNTELHAEDWKLKKQLKYASRSGIRFAVIAGSQERDNGTVMLKDLSEGDQQEIALDALAAHVAGKLA